MTTRQPSSDKSVETETASPATDSVKKPEFPHVTTNDLSSPYTSMLEQAALFKDWKKCKGCEKTQDELTDRKLRRCSECGNDLEGLRVYYCSRQCQRKDWPEHRSVCGKEEASFFQHFSSSEEAKMSKYVNKMWVRWNSGVRPVSDWVIWQLVNSGAQINFQKSYIRIEYDCHPSVFSGRYRHTRHNRKNDQDRYKYAAPYAKSFEVRPVSELSGQGPKLPTLTNTQIRVVHWYSNTAMVSISNISPSAMGTFLSPKHLFPVHTGHSWPTKEELNSSSPTSTLWKCSQWPWVFSTMSLLGETSDVIALLKLTHFLHLISPFLKDAVDPRLSKFKAPLFPDTRSGRTKLIVDPEMVAEWQSYVGRIIDY